jgi:hypothetical protein
LTQSKDGLLKLKKIQIKYDFEGFEIRNNFPYRNFYRFGIKIGFLSKFESKEAGHLRSLGPLV